jgi:hypothetical protein
MRPFVAVDTCCGVLGGHDEGMVRIPLLRRYPILK